jgi:hypothetical protein
MQSPEPLPTPAGYLPEYAEEARKWALMRATDEDLARHFEIPLATLHEWLATVPEFAKAVRTGRMGDADVVDRFHQNCLGFSHEAEKIFRPAAPGEEPVRATYTKRYPPNTSAGKFWLVNRLPGEWRMKVEIEAKHSHGNARTLTRPQLDRQIAEVTELIELLTARGSASAGYPGGLPRMVPPAGP